MLKKKIKILLILSLFMVLLFGCIKDDKTTNADENTIENSTRQQTITSNKTTEDVVTTTETTEEYVTTTEAMDKLQTDSIYGIYAKSNVLL